MYLEGETYFYEERKNEDGMKVKREIVEIGYWRKHPDLHGYIVHHFQSGLDDCRRTPLSMADLCNIYKAVKGDNMPTITGFFFGESRKEDQKMTLGFLDDAMEWLKNEEEDVGSKYVYYTSSW